MGMAGQGRPPDGGLGGCLLPQGACPAGCAPHFLFETSKRKPSRGASLAPAGQFTFCAAPGGKEKMFRRVGLRPRRPPAAGGGRLAVPCRSQGRKRPALGETSSPERSGIPSAALPAAAGSSARERERQRKEKQRQYDNHPDALRTICHGTAASTSQKMIACPKAGQNRSRHRYAAPRAHGGPPHRSAPKRPFLLDRALRSRWRLCRLRMRRTPCGCGPFVSGLSAAAHAAVGLRHAPAGAVFLSRTKRKWGVE